MSQGRIYFVWPNISLILLENSYQSLLKHASFMIYCSKLICLILILSWQNTDQKSDENFQWRNEQLKEQKNNCIWGVLQSKSICKSLVLIAVLEEVKYQSKVKNLDHKHLPKMTVIPMTHLMQDNCLNFIYL